MNYTEHAKLIDNAAFMIKDALKEVFYLTDADSDVKLNHHHSGAQYKFTDTVEMNGHDYKASVIINLIRE